MRVKLLLALAIASIVLLCGASVALAADCNTCGSVPATVSGVPTAAQLTAAADQQCNACGFPDLSTISTVDTAVPADCIDATTLTSPLCGVCGTIPESTCNEAINEICGPQVNLGCPLITTFAVPVNLNVPAVQAAFTPINVAPQVCLGLPQVNLNGVCNDILCSPVTNINSGPVCVTPRPDC